MADSMKNLIAFEVPAGYDASATQITLPQSILDKLPQPPFNLVWFNGTDFPHPAFDPNAEIVRVTDKSGGKITIIRGQEDTSASDKNLPGKMYYMILAPTVKTFEDIDQKINQNTANLQGQIDTHTDQITDLDDRLSDAETELGNKVDKIPGKGLSSNDYTDAEKAKLAIIDEHVYLDNPVADLTALANLTGMPNYARCYVTSEGKYYEYEKDAVAGEVQSNDPRGGYWSVAQGIDVTELPVKVEFVSDTVHKQYFDDGDFKKIEETETGFKIYDAADNLEVEVVVTDNEIYQIEH